MKTKLHSFLIWNKVVRFSLTSSSSITKFYKLVSKNFDISPTAIDLTKIIETAKHARASFIFLFFIKSGQGFWVLHKLENWITGFEPWQWDIHSQLLIPMQPVYSILYWSYWTKNQLKMSIFDLCRYWLCTDYRGYEVTRPGHPRRPLPSHDNIIDRNCFVRGKLDILVFASWG